ncbi:MAG: choice-of-anchor Q domain-containing protein, partial [bacterium]
NGNSYQFAGDNAGAVWIGGPGSQFRGKNEGQMFLNGDGTFALGAFGPLATVTNRGKGSLLLGNLSGGQKAVITDVAHASILLGAGTVSNSQAIVVGDDNASHGNKSVTAGSVWATGTGFFGRGDGLTNLREFDTNALAALAAHTGLSIGAHGAKINRYVSTAGTHVSPFTTWATAATNIQAAVDVALEGETVWVSNGVYAAGSRVTGDMTSRVAITNTITVRSVNGPSGTIIQGTPTICGVYMAEKAWLIGMTVTNGGAYGVDVGGVFGGSLSNCVLTGNTGFMAGGACSNTLYHCTLTGNTGNGGGGGAFACTLFNCVLVRNQSDYAGATCCTLYNCTLADNSGNAGSVANSTVFNSILAGNPDGIEGSTDSSVYFSIYWMPAWLRWGEWEPEDGVNPQFVDYTNGNYRLLANSPCVNAGTNGFWTAGAVDFDGQRRIYPSGGRVDIGAFEFTGDSQALHKGDAVLTAGQALGLGTVGQFMIWGGTQLVFVAGAVTNVLDADIGRP